MATFEGQTCELAFIVFGTSLEPNYEKKQTNK